MIRLLREIAGRRDALLTLVQYNLKSTVATTRLGVVWWLIDPLVMMAIYYFLVRIVFERGGPDYHLFVLTGIVPWQYFARSVRMASRGISSNRALVRQVGLPIAAMVGIPIAVQFVFGAIGIGVVAAWNYDVTGLHSVAALPLLLLVGAFSYGLGLLLAICEVHWSDTNAILGYVLRIGFLLSPVLYPASRVLESASIPDAAKLVYQLNPLSWIFTSFRDVLLDGRAFDWGMYGILLLAALALIEIGLVCLRLQGSTLVKMS